MYQAPNLGGGRSKNRKMTNFLSSNLDDQSLEKDLDKATVLHVDCINSQTKKPSAGGRVCPSLISIRDGSDLINHG